MGSRASRSVGSASSETSYNIVPVRSQRLDHGGGTQRCSMRWFLPLALAGLAHAMPFQVSVQSRSKECLYDNLDAG